MGWACIMNGPDSDGGDVGETAARVATATMKLALTKKMIGSRNNGHLGRGSVWLKAGAARVRAHPTRVYFSIFGDAVVVARGGHSRPAAPRMK